MSVVDRLDLTNPAAVQRRLTEIEQDLAIRQNVYERAAEKWFSAKREIEREKAVQLLASAATTATEKKAAGVAAAAGVEGAEAEAEYEALRAVIGVLETRASICQSLLRAQGRS